jgi:CelD/BcsL family acetyltransferase involved in cellulose biosynthesis
VPTFLEQVDEIYRNSWQAKANGFRPRNTEDELRYYSMIAERGWLRSYILRTDEGPIAFELGFQYDGVFYGHECGFHEKWSEFGPGSVLTHLFIQDLFLQNSPKLLDFLPGRHIYKQSFSNAQHQTSSNYLVPQNHWRPLLAVQGALFAIERGVRAVAISTNLDRPLRNLLKRVGVNVRRYG